VALGAAGVAVFFVLEPQAPSRRTNAAALTTRDAAEWETLATGGTSKFGLTVPRCTSGPVVVFKTVTTC
jgi:hypothetical protein